MTGPLAPGFLLEHHAVPHPPYTKQSQILTVTSDPTAKGTQWDIPSAWLWPAGSTLCPLLSSLLPPTPSTSPQNSVPCRRHAGAWFCQTRLYQPTGPVTASNTCAEGPSCGSRMSSLMAVDQSGSLEVPRIFVPVLGIEHG